MFGHSAVDGMRNETICEHAREDTSKAVLQAAVVFLHGTKSTVYFRNYAALVLPRTKCKMSEITAKTSRR